MGEGNIGDIDVFVKVFCQIDCVLIGQIVGYQDDFMWIGGGFDVGYFYYQWFIDVDVVGGVEQDYIIIVEFCGGYGVVGDFDWVLVFDDWQGIDFVLFIQNFQLFLGGWMVGVE